MSAAPRATVRDGLLDAVGVQLAERSWEAVRMADVATVAGVSRQTLYNEFGSREALAQAYVLREVERFVLQVDGSVRAHADDPQAAARAAFDVFLTAAAEHPLLRSALAGDAGAAELLPLLTFDGGPVLVLGTERLAEVISECWPAAPRDDVRVAAECVVRLAISHATLPTATAEQTAEDVSRALGPWLAELLR